MPHTHIPKILILLTSSIDSIIRFKVGLGRIFWKNFLRIIGSRNTRNNLGIIGLELGIIICIRTGELT